MTRLPAVTVTFLLLCAGLLALSLSIPARAADLTVTAEQNLEWNQKDAFYQARGAAHAKQGEQEIFADDLKAYYDPGTSGRNITRITATGNVRFSDAAHSGAGSTLIYDAGRRDYQLSGPNAHITGPDGHARADKEIHFQRADNIVSLFAAAEIQLSDGRVLKAEEITMFLDAADNIDRITASGTVSVKQASGSTATSDSLDYDRGNDSAILTGNVTVSEGDNHITGDKAEIDFATGTSRMLATKSGGRVSGRFTGTQ